MFFLSGFEKVLKTLAGAIIVCACCLCAVMCLIDTIWMGWEFRPTRRQPSCFLLDRLKAGSGVDDVKVYEDMEDCMRKVDKVNEYEWRVERLIDLRKAYPLIIKSVLWTLLENYNILIIEYPVRNSSGDLR